MGNTYTQDESLLITECLQGNRKSQRKLYDNYAPTLYRLCLNYAKDSTLAEDILQEVFIKIFNNLDKFRGDGPLSAWIRRVTVNTSIEYIRRHKKNATAALEEELPITFAHPSPLEQLYKKDLLKITNSLSKGYKDVFNFYVEGFSHKEIASFFNVSESTSKSQYCRAKITLRKRYLSTI